MDDHIRVSNVHRVFPQPPPNITTLNHPPPPLIELSFLDAFWVQIRPIQRLLFYRTHSPFPSIVRSLISSLSLTLHTFRPFSATLSLSPDSRDLVIDCTGDGGVDFVVAESDEDLERLVADHAAQYNWEAYRRLAPELDAGRLPAPVLAVKVTGFRGGFAVGVSLHHVAADGHSLSRFMKFWAETCRSGEVKVIKEEITFDRTVVKHPRKSDICRRYLDTLAPSRPYMPISAAHNSAHLARRTFIATTKIIESLKTAATTTHRGESAVETEPPTTFVAIVAHAWICVVRAKETEHESTLHFRADCRSRVDPPISYGYCGNCVKVCVVKSRVADLLDEGGLAHACGAIQEAIDDAGRDPLKGCEDWAQYAVRALPGGVVNFVGSHKFGFYKVDFGWGRPGRVEFVSMHYDGTVVLHDTRDDEGGVQLSLALPPHQMEAFATFFVRGWEGFGFGDFLSF
ncbi:Phenolic glucoside malonyltransferase 2 [Acorus gramineus]|uniref:Phenolic glucoside malonyltransferase 2 n=1 Tax=Acorus gramineus TaxID=55184 RepID=A0AAV8ZW23_ACOGR|nr:Phenolic glucoside malonyltransferase 2 [Acorus gramineus]